MLREQVQRDDRVFLAQPADALAELEVQELQEKGVDLMPVTHLGGLHGQPDPVAALRRARTWFPLVGSTVERDHLAWAEVVVLPQHADQPQPDEEGDTIRVAGTPAKGVEKQVISILEQARYADAVHCAKWQTVVRLSRWDFTDNSFELALVLADRIARGREVPAQGRLIATGCSRRWATGEVDTVAGHAQKTRLFVQEAAPGDRILMPAAWRDEVDEQQLKTMRQRGASVAMIEQVTWQTTG